MIRALHTPVRCGIILAGGEGKRLRPFVHRLRGALLPKQYVKFIGTRSMLEHTFRRTEKLIPPERLFTVVSREHLSHSEVRQQLSRRRPDTVVVQPVNKETGPGVLLPLMHVHKRFPDSTVVIFPSDHFIVEEELFMSYVELACRIIDRYPSYLILLGMQPSGPEPEYGYILPVSRLDDRAPPPFREVLQFVEKPSPDAASELIQRGGLWNTMVIAFKINTLLDLVSRVAPQMHRSFSRISQAIGSSTEMEVVKEVYAHIVPTNFSTGLMEAFPIECLLVLPVRGVLWSDWGSEQRIMNVLQKTGRWGRTSAKQSVQDSVKA